jgi:uncharacterized protein
MNEVLLDAGPLVAVLCADDRDHRWAVERFRALSPPFLTCEPVIAEACFLENGLLRVGLEIEDHCAALKNLMKRYRSVPMSLADSCLVRMSEIHPKSELFTLDRDFRVYRRNGRQMIPLIMPQR